MPISISDDPLVERFNARLLQLNSSARVALTRIAGHGGMLELRDDEENFLEFIPAEASPEMAAIAFRLYARGLNRGVWAGEEAAWAKLRYLIGAAATPSQLPRKADTMADTYLSGCFAFRCTNAEMALLEEAFNAAEDLNCELEPPEPSQEFLAAFPPTVGDGPWSGFLGLFDDAAFPILGAELTGGNSFEEPAVSTPMISGTVDFQPWSIAELVRRCCQTSLAKAPICFEWAVTCSRARPGEFGGGRCVIFADRSISSPPRRP